MKSRFILGLTAISVLSLGAAVGCSKKPTSSSDVDFSFTVALESGYKRLRVGASSRIVVTVSGDGNGKKYAYRSSEPSVLSISQDGVATGVSDGLATITVLEQTTNKSATLNVKVSSASEANGGFNYASASGATAIAKRTEILGELEKYAMDNHLTGITLFENGGYVKYASRVHLPTNEYITGYGFGLLSEGSLTAPMENEENPNHKMYLHAASSSEAGTMNEKNNTGSQVSDLAGYITSSYWGTKLNSTKDGYEWYPVLARDKVNIAGTEYDNLRPFPVYDGNIVKPNEDPNPLGLYSTYRIYLRDGVKFRETSDLVDIDGTDVTLADYEFSYRFLLTQSSKQQRGTEMANDTSYGIKGAQRYYLKTEGTTDTEAKKYWDDMKASGELGIQTGTDNGQNYIELTLVNPIDRFTAMYTLSSSLVSPLSETFIRGIATASAVAQDKAIASGAKRYGNFNAGSGTNKMTDYVMCVGPYFLESYEEQKNVVFKKNASWHETGRYNIEGVKIIVITAATTDPDAIYNQFNAGNLDSCGIPSKHIAQEVGKEGVKKTKGDSTFKLNVNSCNQDTWNYLFGPNGKINKGSNWTVKPWMSNDNFLNGLFFSINRKLFADNRGVQPSINYFSDAYLSDPEKGDSYNETAAHKAAVADYETYDKDGQSTFGYDYDRAVLSFKAAVRELAASGAIEKGSKSKPTVINIHIRWMYQSDIKEYGDEIAGYFESAFNNEAVSGGTVILKVQQAAVTNWMEVYNEYLMKGQFDLGFGAISGNTYNPLNFLEVLRSDNSSTFTLNWGTDTSSVTEGKPVEYDHKLWSFDALWEAADHGTVVEGGRAVKSVKECYMTVPTAIGDTSTQINVLSSGFETTIPVIFISVPDVAFNVTRLQLFIYKSGSVDLPVTKDPETGTLLVTVSAAQAKDINDEIRRVNKLDQHDEKEDPTPFRYDTYDVYWAFEINYTLSISGGTPSETYAAVAKNKGAQINSSRLSFVGGR